MLSLVTIGEDLLLLAIDPQDGRVQAVEQLGVALRAAEVMDLRLAGRVEPAGSGVKVLDPRPLGHPLLDRLLTALYAEGGARRLDLWLTERPPEPGPGPINQYVTLLADRGLIRIERQGDGGRARTRLVLVDLERCAYARTRIDNIATAGDRALGSVVHSCGLDEYLYPGLRGRPARRRLARLTEPQQTSPGGGRGEPRASADVAIADAVARKLSDSFANLIR